MMACFSEDIKEILIVNWNYVMDFSVFLTII